MLRYTGDLKSGQDGSSHVKGFILDGYITSKSQTLQDMRPKNNQAAVSSLVISTEAFFRFRTSSEE